MLVIWVAASGHDEAPFVQEKAKSIQHQVAWERLLTIHKVADQNKEHDEDVQMHRGSQEEMVAKEEEGLYTISALDRPDDAGSFRSIHRVVGDFDRDCSCKDGHGK